MTDVTAKLAAWIEEAVEYVNSETRSPSLEREGRALLAAYEQAQAEPSKPLTDDQHRRMCALYFGDCSARMHDFLIEYGKRVEAAHGIKEQP